MRSPLLQLLVRWLVLALGVVLATRLVPGIHCADAGTLIAVVMLLHFSHAILRPLLVLFTLPFIFLTLGLGMLVINALLFMLVGWLVNGFSVNGFWPACGGALVVSITDIVLSRLTRWEAGGPRDAPLPTSKRNRKAKPDDVIDV